MTASGGALLYKHKSDILKYAEFMWLFAFSAASIRLYIALIYRKPFFTQLSLP